MGLLKFLFGMNSTARHANPVDNPDTVRQTQSYAPGTRIPYDDKLIARLINEHHRLIRIFSNIIQSFDNGDLTKTVDLLRSFHSEIRAHLLSEKVQLYIYLQHTLVDDDLGFTLMRELQHEMDDIGRELVAFLTKYENLCTIPRLADSFKEEHNAIGQVLAVRIRREEQTLYPLYMPC
jgi:hypothetical protein